MVLIVIQVKQGTRGNGRLIKSIKLKPFKPIIIHPMSKGSRFFNRPGVAGAVLQTPLLLIN